MSRAGSQVIKIGRRESDVLVDVSLGGGKVVETISIIPDILSSSSGQMSGQCVNPK